MTYNDAHVNLPHCIFTNFCHSQSSLLALPTQSLHQCIWPSCKLHYKNIIVHLPPPPLMIKINMSITVIVSVANVCKTVLIVADVLRTWLLWIDIAHANLRGSCLRETTVPPPTRTVHFSGPMVSSSPEANRIIGWPEQLGQWLV